MPMDSLNNFPNRYKKLHLRVHMRTAAGWEKLIPSLT